MISRIISIILILLLFPLLVLIATIILVDNGFPVLFRQKRIGLNNNKFIVYKFRTMKKDVSDIATHLISDEKHIFISSGKFLRKFSFDELPQLINILKGEMKFIGPRPALYNQNDLIQLRTDRGIHKLFPGITGWAQINGRDDLSILEKVDLDYYYLANKSYLLNLKIIIVTISQIIFPKGVSH
tara:strand:+ start:89838 stop:90389 length:552 start_codon:yes stop_codon:yes gene_type:complete